MDFDVGFMIYGLTDPHRSMYAHLLGTSERVKCPQPCTLPRRGTLVIRTMSILQFLHCLALPLLHSPYVSKDGAVFESFFLFFPVPCNVVAGVMKEGGSKQNDV